MKTHIDNHIPYEATHVGEYIFDEMEARNMTQKELAKALEIQPSYLNEIIKGTRDINAEIAVQLEKVWGTKAYIWLALQAKDEIDLVRITYRGVEMPAVIWSKKTPNLKGVTGVA